MNRHIFILALIVIVAAGLGLALNDDPTERSLPSGQRLLPSLAKSAGEVTEIRLERAQGEQLHVRRQGQQWLMTSHGDYPVDPAQLSALMTQLVEATKVQAKTRQSTLYDRLGLQSIEQPDSMARRLTLNAGDKQWQVLVGNQPASGHGQYVRVVGNEQSWLIDKSLSLPAMAQEWLRQPVIELEASRIKRIERKGAEQWTIYKLAPEQSDYLLADLPKQRQLKYATVLNMLPNNLGQVNFEQQWRDEAFDVALEDPYAQIEVTLFDETAVTFMLYRQQEQHYLVLASEQMDGIWQNRVYAISGFTARQLAKSREDFLKPLPETDAGASGVSTMEEGEAPQ